MKHYPFLTISGASGVGKTTLMEALIARFPEKFHAFESVTTRARRPTDKESYRNLSPLQFSQWEKEGRFAWTLDVHGTRYGTTRKSIDEALKDTRTSIFVIAPEIVEKLQAIVGKENVFPLYILSCPPHILRTRLLERGEGEEAIGRRIADCLTWDSQARKSAVPFHFAENEGTMDDLVDNVLKLLIEDK